MLKFGSKIIKQKRLLSTSNVFLYSKNVTNKTPDDSYWRRLKEADKLSNTFQNQAGVDILLQLIREYPKEFAAYERLHLSYINTARGTGMPAALAEEFYSKLEKNFPEKVKKAKETVDKMYGRKPR